MNSCTNGYFIRWVNIVEYDRLYQFHIAEPLTLVQLATETRMSSRHFIRFFREVFRKLIGISPSEYRKSQ
ncbi:AraC family transcriptional regulator [Paenibacillus sp.]|uniref:AraC family transcriptional regulator n=1 Tax=Paenibacillus sp. TaxID=58172 RepID=UPI0037C82A02